jgi:voltage-gated potassium channel
LVWLYERDINPSITTFGDVIWWWVISSTTVGYGDIVPITMPGRLAATVTIVTGIYLYTNFITLTADSIHRNLDKNRLGTARVRARNHIAICEYTAFADELIQELQDYPALVNREVVIISDLVAVNPYPQHAFVRGVPLSPMALQQANIQEAAFIFVFANLRFTEPDLKTIHTVSRIQRLNQHATIFVEIHEPRSRFVEQLPDSVQILESKVMLESVLRGHKLILGPHFSRDLDEQPEKITF